MDVGTWLRGLGLEQYEQAFRDNDVDAGVLPELTAEDLNGLGVTSIGHRRKLLAAIAALRDGAASSPPSSRAEPAPPVVPSPAPRAHEAERRQLTVMFVDLVGSTALSRRLDPEDMGALLRAYQDAVAGGVARFGGHIAKFMGDGVLAYFGWPTAHEDAAERAVRAAIVVLEAVGWMRAGSVGPLAARVGIATGLVLVGDLIGEGTAQEEVVVGETPNLAARLQELAEPHTIIVAEGTRRLLGGLFEVRDLGGQRLRGFGEPVHAWHILGPAAAESRFEALHADGVAPLVGREQELALLLDRWARARLGEGQVVLLSGEPGIGKSRIVLALRERLRAEPRTSLRYHCSPFHSQSALWPVIGQLERAAGFARNDNPAAKAAKLQALFQQAARVPDALPFVADLLSVPLPEGMARPEMPPQERKARTFATLLAQLEALAAEKPVLMVLEDAHWIDPTTLELFDQIVERIQRLPALLVVTFRPEFAPPWAGHAHTTLLGLNRLGAREVAAIVERVTGGKALPPGVFEQILAKTDGVPLFVEELTKAMLETGLLREDGGRYVLDSPLPSLAIPDTLHGSLLARLDRLALVKEVAQIGAVIGRQFGHELLAAVAPLDGAVLDDALRQLLAAELVFHRGQPPEATYVFKHALVQDAAYASLPRSRRQQLHAQVARVLEERFPAMTESEPEILAHHLTEAGLGDRATTYWLAAGRQAAERSANKEATAYLRRGLELLRELPEAPSRDVLELDLLLALGPVLCVLRGYAMPETEEVYARAYELSRSDRDGTRRFAATWGLWLPNFLRANFQAATQLAEELLGLARNQADDGLLLQAHHAAWTTAIALPDLQACYEHCEQGIALYDPERHRTHKFVYAGHDPGVCGRMNGAAALWLLGRPAQALERAEEGLALAARLSHSLSRALALAFAASLHHFRREPGPAAARAQAMIALAAQHEVAPHYAAMARIIEGWSLVMRQQAEEGTALARRGLDEMRSLRSVQRLPYLTAILAECEAAASRKDAALSTLETAFDLMRRIGERRWEAEMHRLHGQFLLGAGRSGCEQAAEASFLRALEVARGQGARSLELRAAISLVRLWAKQRRGEARDLLVKVYAGFAEGFDTPDLQEAKELLDALG